LSNSVEVIERAVRKLAPGRVSYFMEAHIVKALRTIDDEGPVGRVKLSKALGLGEGMTRTLIKHLINEGLIETSRAGIVLTKSGKRLSLDLKSRISEAIEIPRSSLTIGPLNIAILVKNAANAIKGGVEQRDAAIKVGALGATTLVFKHDKLSIPLGNQATFKDARALPAIRKGLISGLNPQENDVIIIGSANDKSTAELGAIAATLETLKVAAHKLQK
jgi:predicted transcriptional regulator